MTARFPELPDESITVAIELAAWRLAAPAKVPNYLPVLIERDVRAQLVACTR